MNGEDTRIVGDGTAVACRSVEGSPKCVSPGQSCGSLPAYFPVPLLAAAQFRTLRRWQFLFRAGEPVRMLHTVESGEIRLVQQRPDCGEVTLQTFTPGQTIAECSVCLDEYSCSAVATRQSRVVSVPMKLFNHLLVRDNDFAVAWAHDLAWRLRDMYLRQERLRMKSTRERVMHYLICHQGHDGSVGFEFSASTWALELGITHENLYRTLAELEKEKILKREGRKIVLGPPTKFR